MDNLSPNQPFDFVMFPANAWLFLINTGLYLRVFNIFLYFLADYILIKECPETENNDR